MNYYKKHLGDYAKKTGHLSPLEHGVYGLIMDAYYDREQGPTLIEATRWARARTDDEKSAVLAVLDEFFKLGDDGRYIQNRIEDELCTYRVQAEVNRVIAVEREKRKRERRENDASTNRAPIVYGEDHDREPIHKPIANSHNPIDKPIGAFAPEASGFALVPVGEDQESASKPEYPDDFERAWAAYPARHGGNPKKDAFKHWSARKREGEAVADMQAGVERYAAHLKAAGKLGTEYVMQAVRFFGTSKQYTEPWPIGPAPQAKQAGRPSINAVADLGADDPFNNFRRA